MCNVKGQRKGLALFCARSKTDLTEVPATGIQHPGRQKYSFANGEAYSFFIIGAAFLLSSRIYK